MVGSDYTAARQGESAAAIPEAGGEAVQQARRIIADARAAYTACDTYEDDGKYDIVYRGDAGFSEETEFHTAVAGPDAIRFAYRDLPTQFGDSVFTQLVASDAGVLSFMPWQHEPERAQSLDEAVGGLMGVSHGLSRAVLPLLPIGLTGPSALDVTDPLYSGAEEIDGTMCDRIEGVERRDDGTVRVHVRLWIARDDGLIRQRSEDDVWNADDARQVQMSGEAVESTALQLREAGLPEAAIQKILEIEHSARPPLSTFATVTYHARCNEPVSPESLRATDGSL